MEIASQRENQRYGREGQRVCSMGVGDRDGERTRDMIERVRECAIWVLEIEMEREPEIW